MQSRLFNLRCFTDRKISFIKDLRSIQSALGESERLGLKEAKALADRAMDKGLPVVVEVPGHLVPFFTAWVDSRPDTDATELAAPQITADDVEYVRQASYALPYDEDALGGTPAYDGAAHNRVVDALYQIVENTAVETDLPLS